MRKRGVVILMAAALTASVPATALADQFAGQIALNGEAASEDVADEDSQVDMDQTEEADDEDHEKSEDTDLKGTDEAEAGTEESNPEESEPEESEEEVKEDVKYDQMNAVGFHIPGAFDKVLAMKSAGYRMISATRYAMRFVTMHTNTIILSLICVLKKECFAT